MTNHRKWSESDRRWLLVDILLAVILVAMTIGMAFAAGREAGTESGSAAGVSSSRTESAGGAGAVAVKNTSKVLNISPFDEAGSRSAKQIRKTAAKVYRVKFSADVRKDLDSRYDKDQYSESKMFLAHDPFGTNYLSLFVRFRSGTPVRTSYTVRAGQDGSGTGSLPAFTRTAEKSVKKDHAFTLTGLVPGRENRITFTFTAKSGKKTRTTVNYQVPAALGKESVRLGRTGTKTADNGLFALLGGTSKQNAFIFYYDVNGVLRGEVPLMGYRAERICRSGDRILYSVSKHRIASVDALGQVRQVVNTGNYTLHHDMAVTDSGTVLALASRDTGSFWGSENEDLILKITKSGKVSELLDMKDLLGSYRSLTRAPRTANVDAESGLDWIHLDSIAWAGNDSIIVSSRETSSIFRIRGISKKPKLDYIIGEKTFWRNTPYESRLLKRTGLSFPAAAGQNTVMIDRSGSGLKNGQYYLTLFDNNYGRSDTRTGFSWSGAIDGVSTKRESEMTAREKKNTRSYYYRYRIDPAKKTCSLVTRFAVPYSSYDGSVQDVEKTVVVCSPSEHGFEIYNLDGERIRRFRTGAGIRNLRRVFQYGFDGFYFNAE